VIGHAFADRRDRTAGMDVTGHHQRVIDGRQPEDGERPVDAERPRDEGLGIRRREKPKDASRTAPATVARVSLDGMPFS